MRPWRAPLAARVEASNPDLSALEALTLRPRGRVGPCIRPTLRRENPRVASASLIGTLVDAYVNANVVKAEAALKVAKGGRS